MGFIKKGDREKVEIINKWMGMYHRTKPYDLKKSSDLIQLTVMATAEYMDLYYYHSNIQDVCEAYDESLEHFHPDDWINLNEDSEENDNKDIANLLAELDFTFLNVVNKAEDQCRQAWLHVCECSSEEVYKYFFGEMLDITTEVFSAAVDETIEDISSIEYKYNIEDNTKCFAEKLRSNITGS